MVGVLLLPFHHLPKDRNPCCAHFCGILLISTIGTNVKNVGGRVKTTAHNLSIWVPLPESGLGLGSFLHWPLPQPKAQWLLPDRSAPGPGSSENRCRTRWAPPGPTVLHCEKRWAGVNTKQESRSLLAPSATTQTPGQAYLPKSQSLRTAVSGSTSRF